MSNSFFTVKQLLIEDYYEYTKQQDYTLMSVLSGEGTLTADGQVYTIRKGDHFILTTEDKEIKIQGKLDIIESYV